jgi:hypothetical protein
MRVDLGQSLNREHYTHLVPHRSVADPRTAAGINSRGPPLIGSSHKILCEVFTCDLTSFSSIPLVKSQFVLSSISNRAFVSQMRCDAIP